MLRKTTSATISIPEQRPIWLETGEVATQAAGSVIVRMGDTMLLATVTTKENIETGHQFLPLSVDYQEKFAASGKIPGGFLKREGPLGEHEVLVARLVDRSIRPLFPKDFFDEIQVNISLISADDQLLPDSLAALAASAALCLADVPFQGPISQVRVARIGGKLIVNPPAKLIKQADLDLIVAATKDHVVMVEGEMNQVQEADLLEAICVAHDSIKVHCQVQEQLIQDAGITKSKLIPSDMTNPKQLDSTLYQAIYNDLYSVARQALPSKEERSNAFGLIKQSYIDKGLFQQDEQESPWNLQEQQALLNGIERKAIRDLLLNEGQRIDGRKADEVRGIDAQVGYLPAAHGSALFTRGETQSLTTITLGSKLDEQIIDRALEDGYSRFMLHYNFPGFATGEVKPNRGPSRREIGHGNLARRALKAAFPEEQQSLYTIRIVSDILESNGSSSMATVCAASLALMDAAIPIQSHISGIAMGLIIDPVTGDYAVLSDILGEEDGIGDMDFKITGTAQGITACQMDIKVAGLSYEILEKALVQAKVGRKHILDKMNKTISEPRDEYKPHAPRITNIAIEKEMIGAIIGPGGKVIQQIQKETSTKIDLTEEGATPMVTIFASNKDTLEQATERIQAIIAKPTVGEIYTGKVKTILPYGAFVEFMTGKDGLLHISEVSTSRIEDLETVLQVGETIQVKLIGINVKTGKYRLSRKALLSPENGVSTS